MDNKQQFIVVSNNTHKTLTIEESSLVAGGHTCTEQCYIGINGEWVCMPVCTGGPEPGGPVWL
jgi:hypothetical protein